MTLPSGSSSSARADRNGAVDLARFLGALGIVWFHESASFTWIGYAALPMFMAFVLYFSLFSAGRRTGRQDAFLWGKRLLVPWLAWCVIYGLAKVVDAMVKDAPLSSEFDTWMLLTGSKIHLWFLPFAFVAGLLIRQAVMSLHYSDRTFWALNIGFVAIQLASFWLLTSFVMERPLDQWLFVVPACYLGVMLCAADGKQLRLLAVCVAAAIAFAIASSLGWHHGVAQMVIATIMCTAVLTIQIQASATTDFLSSIALGVYLIHPLIHAVLLRLVDLQPYTWAFALLVLALSIMAIAVMRRTPILRQII